LRLTFRAKLTIIVGTAALTFIALAIMNAVIAERVARQLATIEKGYLPKIELGPKLEADVERLRRSLQDAVAAQDKQALAATRATKNELLEAVARAGDAVSARDAAAFRAALDDYYTEGSEVSARLIAGETGEALVSAIALMQQKQARMLELVRKLGVFDRRELARAFLAATRAEASATQTRLAVSVGCLLVVVLLSLALSRGVLRSLSELSAGFERFGKSDFKHAIPVTSSDELGELALRANEMALSLERLGAERDRTDWLKNGHAGLVHDLRGELDLHDVARRAVSFLARYLSAPAGALYSAAEDGSWHLLGQFSASLDGASQTTPSFKPGEGLVGQAALQESIMVVSDLPANYLRVRSGLGEAAPRAIVLVPLVHLGRVTGVLELACFGPWSELYNELLSSVRETLAIAIEVARARAAVNELLGQTRRQADRLSAQEDELRATNEELQAQQEELRGTNLQLTRQTSALEEQRRVLQHKNVELDDVRQNLERKAAELTTVSAYKTQFLANMSHELRTPLNSLLLLSNLLAENESGNLTDKQVEFCRTIYGAGKDLLALINQVLDLAKVESGKQELRIADMSIAQLAERVKRIFEPLAHDKGLDFVVELAPGLPATISTDVQRVEQILNNLLGNAIKFTERGHVRLRIDAPEPSMRFQRQDLDRARCLALTVSDTGIGIPKEHQQRIFAPFEQVEATPDRRYGGTGLGLTIARELSWLLGGELLLRSIPGQGSTFICHLPYNAVQRADTPAPRAPAAEGSVTGLLSRAAVAVAEARSAPRDAQAADGEKQLLVIEDDLVFAGVVRDVIEAQGLKCILAQDGASGLRLAQERRPDGIILDVTLSDIDGFQIMEALRSDSATAAIPVHFVSAVEAAERGLALGAVGYLTKPVTRTQLIGAVESLVSKVGDRKCRILVVEDDANDAATVLDQLELHAFDARRVGSAREALAALTREDFQCVIMDLGLPDMDGLELLQSLQEHPEREVPPIVVYTGRALTKAETQRIEAYTEAVVLKGGRASERLVDELRLFTQRLHDGLPTKRQAAVHAASIHVQLARRKILVADDDMRTVYALSALLRAKGAEVLVADTGRVALDVLAKHPEIEIVLMDIMMPEMDGYEAMRRIRKDEKLQALPIIALTAKAMKSDRDKCLEAGATDYMPKPIDAERLLVMLQSYLRGEAHGAEQPRQ
jgi:CheY-like chemotaxis protein